MQTMNLFNFHLEPDTVLLDRASQVGSWVTPHTRTRTHAHSRAHAHARTRTHAHARTRTRTQAHAHAHAHAHTHTHTHTLLLFFASFTEVMNVTHRAATPTGRSSRQTSPETSPGMMVPLIMPRNILMCSSNLIMLLCVFWLLFTLLLIVSVWTVCKLWASLSVRISATVEIFRFRVLQV